MPQFGQIIAHFLDKIPQDEPPITQNFLFLLPRQPELRIVIAQVLQKVDRLLCHPNNLVRHGQLHSTDAANKVLRRVEPLLFNDLFNLTNALLSQTPLARE